MSSWRRVLLAFTFGVCVGGLILGLVVVFRSPLPTARSASRMDAAEASASPAKTNQLISISNVLPSRHPMEDKIDVLVEKRLRRALEPAQNGDVIETLDDWLTIRLRLIEQIADPEQSESVLVELKYLYDQAFIPGTTDDSLTSVELLVQYAFVEWTKQNPENALNLEEKWNPRPPTRDWRPMEAILYEWQKEDPAAALGALIDRFEHEPDAHQGGPGGFLVHYLDDPTILFALTKDVSHRWLVSELRSLAELWRRKDEAAMEAFFAECPEHPANPKTG